MPPRTTRVSKTETGFNLTQAVRVGKIAIKASIGLLLFLIVGRFVFNGAVDLYKALNPPPPPPPTVGFGILPNLVFTPVRTTQPSKYTLETADGGLPYFGDRAKVFFMPDSTQSLLSLDEAKAKAADFGFRSEPQELSNNVYRWRKADVLNETLELESVYFNFEHSSDYLARTELQSGRDLPATFDAVSTAKSFFSKADLLPADVATNSAEPKFLKIVGGTLREAVSLSDAQVLEIGLSRTPIDLLYPPINSRGTAETLIARLATIGSELQVISALRRYFSLDYTLVETYPLKTPQEAWNLLKSGNGHIAFSPSETVTVRSLELGYFESDEYQKYYQPVYIFKGDGGFVGLVPAVSQLFLDTATAKPSPSAEVITL